MTTPALILCPIGAERHLLYGSGARFTASAGRTLTVRPIDEDAVTIRVPRRETSLRMQGGETLSLTIAAADVIEIV